MVKRIWNWFWKPSSIWGRGVILFTGGIAGVVLLGGLSTFSEYQNTLEFCISCHEMEQTVYQEYKKSVHYINTSGVRTTCADCHVPRAWGPKLVRKIDAGKELLHHFLGTINTPDKFETRRFELAKKVWASMEANDSRQCRHCHFVDAMIFNKHKNKDAAKRMETALKEGKTCINCHKSTAHKLPDMTSGYKALFEELETLSRKENAKADKLYTLAMKALFLAKNDVEPSGKGQGKLLPATELSVLERRGDRLKVRIDGWQQDGVAPLIYALQGKRIFSAALKKEAQPEVKVVKTMIDPDTDLTWHEVNFTCWVTKDGLISDQEKLWDYGAEMHSSNCSRCHSATPANHFLANQWMGSLKAMARNINFDKREYRFFLKYLQFHAKDTGGIQH